MESQLDEWGRRIWNHGLARLWTPLPDPDKPDLPYRPGLRLSIRRHVPIPPFGHCYSTEQPVRYECDKQESYYMKLTDWALFYPPSTSPPHPDPAVVGLQIIDEIACKDGRGAQVVRCRLDTEPERILVAKIYDAFYYSYVSHQGGPADVTSKADLDYSHEAAAYEALRDANVDGQVVLKYYGSWTFDVPVPEALRALDTPYPIDPTRPVRMVLMEWIDGISLEKLEVDDKAAKTIAPEIRLEILAKAMENMCVIKSIGVKHNDFASRNVVVSPATGWTMARLPAVYIIDFNIADLTRSPYYTRRDVPPPLPMNPRYAFRNHPPFGWWVPRQYRRGKPFNGWLNSRWRPEEEGYYNHTPEVRANYNADEFRFEPVRPNSPPRPSEFGKDIEYIAGPTVSDYDEEKEKREKQGEEREDE